ncbi:MAG: aromatic ring-hydroxylating dioxygenase subunit alpha [Pigmentiphaga sp.]|nr:aromatic ring-hydroxylating dioxygenase subunit alpha [Pigmentiphaga sp.]
MTLPLLRNCWYVAAWDHEILGDTLLERTILGQSLVLYRKQDGQPVAMNNKCPHRHAPLSMGRKEGDALRCMYHGLRFAPDGRCTEIPGQANIPPGTCVRTYPVAQRHRWVWIWMGDPALADPAEIPDTPAQTDPGWRMKPGYKNFAADYLLISDNLLDFSHLSYIHERTLGGSPNIAEARPEVRRMERGIRVTRKVPDTVPAPYHQRLGKFAGRVDRWFHYDYVLPGILLMDAGVKDAGKADDDLEGALLFNSTQALTPETEHSTHYFFMQAHNFALDDATITESIYQSLCTAFEEDRLMIEAQARLIRSTPAEPMLPINADAALQQFRWLVQKFWKAERQDEPAAQRLSA